MRKKKKRNYNGRLFRELRPYKVNEIAQKLNLDPRTVQGWIKDKELYPTEYKRPYLVTGFELRRFFKRLTKKGKNPLGPGQFFCPRCKGPRFSLPAHLKVVRTGKMLGGNREKIILKGICACKAKLTLFTSQAKFPQWEQAHLNQPPTPTPEPKESPPPPRRTGGKRAKKKSGPEGESLAFNF
jgi:hypothetical protein